MITKRLAALTLALAGSQAFAQTGPETGETRYEVTITNITLAQSFTPQLLASHGGVARIFELGTPASPGLERLAEGGDTAGLVEELGQSLGMAMTVDGLLGPGQSVTAELTAVDNKRHFSMAAMLLPTNDTFVAVNRARLPRRGSVTYMVPAYDAGTEENDQDCANIPGPTCGGVPFSDPAEGDEGFVHVSNGFHDLGGNALAPAAYDWRNPVARVVVKRLD